jgi:hypothetical protein
MLGYIFGLSSGYAQQSVAPGYLQMSSSQDLTSRWLQSAMTNAFRQAKSEPRFRSIKPASPMTDKQARLLIAGGAISHRSPA